MSSDPEDDDGDMEYLVNLDRFLAGEEQTTSYFQLEKRGFAPPQLEELADDEVNVALTNLIWGLNDVGVIIYDTDHLSDRELYKELLDYCDEPTMILPAKGNGGMHWSPIGAYSEEDIQIWLRYYATEEEREEHREQYSEEIPPAELPPYPRPWLPVRQYIVEDDD